MKKVRDFNMTTHIKKLQHYSQVIPLYDQHVIQNHPKIVKINSKINMTNDIYYYNPVAKFDGGNQNDEEPDLTYLKITKYPQCATLQEAINQIKFTVKQRKQ